MVLHLLPAVGAGGAGFLYHRLKMAVVHVTKHAGEVPAGPEFVTRRVGAADGFKGGNFVAHGFSFSS
jgi:hypothetical protein